MTLPQAKEAWGQQKLEEAGRTLSWSFGGSRRLLTPRTTRKSLSIVLSHHVSGNFFSSPWKLVQMVPSGHSDFNGFLRLPCSPAHTSPPGLNVPAPGPPFLPLSVYSPLPSTESLCSILSTSEFPEEVLYLPRKHPLWVPPLTLTSSSTKQRRPLLPHVPHSFGTQHMPICMHACLLCSVDDNSQHVSALQSAEPLPHTVAHLIFTQRH